MAEEILELAVESIEERFEKEVEAFKPADEDHRFVIKVEDTSIVINAGEKSFRPANRGKTSTYVRLRKFFRDVGLEPRHG